MVYSAERCSSLDTLPSLPVCGGREVYSKLQVCTYVFVDCWPERTVGMHDECRNLVNRVTLVVIDANCTDVTGQCP